MNQMKIGKFIKELRTEKKMTQADLAEKLGVSNRAVSKWENGLNMPDVSLLRPICEIFDITINELLSAEKIEDEKKAEKLEEDYICAVDSKIKLQNDVAGYLILKLLAFFCFFIVFAFFGINAWWVTAILLIGFALMVASSIKLVKSWNIIPKIIYVLVIFCITVGIYKFIEYQYLDESNLSHPRFYYAKKERDNCIIYKTIFYNCTKLKSDDKKARAEHKPGTCSITLKSDYEELWSYFGIHNADEYLNSKFCDYGYDYSKDCDVVRCDENGTPLHIKDNEESN